MYVQTRVDSLIAISVAALLGQWPVKLFTLKPQEVQYEK